MNVLHGRKLAIRRLQVIWLVHSFPNIGAHQNLCSRNRNAMVKKGRLPNNTINAHTSRFTCFCGEPFIYQEKFPSSRWLWKWTVSIDKVHYCMSGQLRLKSACASSKTDQYLLFSVQIPQVLKTVDVNRLIGWTLRLPVAHTVLSLRISHMLYFLVPLPHLYLTATWKSHLSEDSVLLTFPVFH